MAPRSELHALLQAIIGEGAVYFQPPPTVQMAYPCIVYRRDYREIRHANDEPYKHDKRYLVTVIDRDPDSAIPEAIAELPKCSFDRFYTADDLNHDVYKLFF